MPSSRAPPGGHREREREALHPRRGHARTPRTRGSMGEEDDSDGTIRLHTMSERRWQRLEAAAAEPAPWSDRRCEEWMGWLSLCREDGTELDALLEAVTGALGETFLARLRREGGGWEAATPAARVLYTLCAVRGRKAIAALLPTDRPRCEQLLRACLATFADRRLLDAAEPIGRPAVAVGSALVGVPVGSAGGGRLDAVAIADAT
eukprot:ctg_1456.g509